MEEENKLDINNPIIYSARVLWNIFVWGSGIYAMAHYIQFSGLWVIMMLVLTDNTNSNEPLSQQLLNFLEFLESSKVVAKYVFVFLYALLANALLQEIVSLVLFYAKK